MDIYDGRSELISPEEFEKITLENILEWKNLQPIESPLSNCYKCEANMCNPHSPHSECTGDQYDYKKDCVWKKYTEEELINEWRLENLKIII